jgi:hypothetical protein
VAALYLPATHVVHTVPCKIYPALHVQDVTAVAPCDFVVEAVGQFVHTALPLSVLYLPVAQAVHEPAGPVFPGEQGIPVQAPLDELELGEVFPAGQFSQVAGPPH